MSEQEKVAATAGRPPRAAAPSAPDLLRAALEKIVFFEWRLGELAAELAGAQSRAASAEQERARADEARRAADVQAQAARLQLAELEADRARMAALLARPHPAPAIDLAALEAERERAAALRAELDEARGELERQKLERSRWLEEMIAQARQGDEAPAALAQFISELRGEVIALRDWQRGAAALLAQAGLEAPPLHLSQGPHPAPEREPEAVEAARQLWAEGRLGGLGAELDRAAAAQAVGRTREAPPAPAATDLLPGLAALRAAAPAAPAPRPEGSAAARALAEQCLKGLAASDPARRAQAARHLAALPTPAAAPALAAALGRETDPRARAGVARALAACGGDAAAGMVEALLAAHEPALVRLAALEALAGVPGPRALAALETASADESPALRRRAASLAQMVDGAADLLARLAADPDAKVRAAALAGDPAALAHDPSRAPSAAPPPPHSPARAPPPSHALAPPPAPSPSAAPPRHAPTEELPIAPLAQDEESEPPRPRLVPTDGRATEALLAVRASIFGLTEAELAQSLGLSADDGAGLVARLLEQGRLARRGRRLVAGATAEEVPLARAERGA